MTDTSAYRLSPQFIENYKNWRTKSTADAVFRYLRENYIQKNSNGLIPFTTIRISRDNLDWFQKELLGLEREAVNKGGMNWCYPAVAAPIRPTNTARLPPPFQLQPIAPIHKIYKPIVNLQRQISRTSYPITNRGSPAYTVPNPNPMPIIKTSNAKKLFPIPAFKQKTPIPSVTAVNIPAKRERDSEKEMSRNKEELDICMKKSKNNESIPVVAPPTPVSPVVSESVAVVEVEDKLKSLMEQVEERLDKIQMNVQNTQLPRFSPLEVMSVELRTKIELQQRKKAERMRITEQAKVKIGIQE